MEKSTLVFLVDQDLISSMILKSKLVENVSFQIKTYSNAQECVMNCHSNPEVILLDFSTEGLQGVDAGSTFREVRRRCPEGIVVLLSTADNFDVVQNYLSEPNVYQVSKGPNFSANVKGLVESILDGTIIEKNVA